MAAPRSPRPMRPLRERASLRPEQLRRQLDPARLGFATTAEVEPLVGTIGQPRALEAIELGLETTTHGFNVFASGPPGTGRRTTVLDMLKTRAVTRPAPDDWVYVYDFRAPDRPRAIRLRPGEGTALAAAMDEFVESARREVPRAFESEEYDRRRREILAAASGKREQLEGELTAFAAERGFALQTSLSGVVSIPLVDGKPISREVFEKLPRPEQERIERGGAEIEERTAAYLRAVHQLAKQATVEVSQLEREVALFATGPLFRELEERWRDRPEVLDHLEGVKGEMLERLDDFRGEEEAPTLFGTQAKRDFTRFRVNVFVDNGASEGVPVVAERNPTYYNLLGRIEYRATLGAMVTDFREIKPGAIHRANGGFLVLDVLDVLRHPFSWDGLKRALLGRAARIENLAEEFAGLPSASLRPESIPLDVKVVLIGSSRAYHVLYALDEEFRELFKVKADFAPELDWSAENHRNYARFVSRWVRENGLLHFDAGGVARVIEHGARLREHRDKLSARLLDVSDIVSEASFRAARAGHALVRAADVEEAVRMRVYRSNLLEERVQELIRDGTLRIETKGARSGIVNGLSVLDLGDHAFGRPIRVSARVSLGRGHVASIEREIELSGPIHSKGFLILSGYLAATYAQDIPLALAATLTFEQSYDEVEGDSASVAELCALVSALADTPVDQGVAVTGSVDQHGRVQAVGGVTLKVEGFFATCRARGLTGTQGVVVPAANVRNLMLDAEVVDAVAAGRFHVWAVRTVDEALELLTGRRARDVHGLARARLARNAELLREADARPDEV